MSLEKGAGLFFVRNKGAEIRHKETTPAEGQTRGHQSFTEKLETLTSFTMLMVLA